MPFNVGQAIEDATNWFLKAPVVKNIAKSTIATTTVITIFIILLVAFVYRDVESEEGRHILALRSGIWCFFIVFGFLHLHQKILESNGTTTVKNELFAPVILESVVADSPITEPSQ